MRRLTRCCGGLDRHQWEEVHFWIAAGLLGILTIHLFLHWKWIASVIQGKPGEGSGIRATLGIVSLTVLLVAAALPFLSPTEWKTHSGKPGLPGKHQAKSELDETDSLLNEKPYEDAVTEKAPPRDIRGSMTLQEVEDATGVPAGHILQALGLPEDTSPQKKLGRLRKEFGFSIQEVRDIVGNYQE